MSKLVKIYDKWLELKVFNHNMSKILVYKKIK